MRILKAIVFIIICNGLGAIGSLATSQSVNTWYAEVVKPSFNPPNWIFGPVWTLLFTLMGIALYLVWEQRGRKKEQQEAIVLFFTQMILNILWSFLFFGQQNPALAFAEIILLWIFILLTIIYFAKVSKLASYLLLPYLLWVSFAAFLNFSIWQLN